ncbi:hypothetical protein D1007_30636 [Hordeum vulgare]|nr:hypothetical protein D1007_30636 [Hordeum vulgare]
MPIIFDPVVHPDPITAVGCLPLLVSPTIRNLKVTKMLVNGGADMNVISPNVIKWLQIPDEDLEETGMFQGIGPGKIQPKGKITLSVTFGSDLNYRTEKVVFDVAKIPLRYNGILGHPALAKFMAASNYAYNTLKLLGPMSVITIHFDKKDAHICTNHLYREALATSAAKAPAPAAGARGKKTDKKASCAPSGKRTSSECCVASDDVPESSNARTKKSKASPPETNKVPAKEDGKGGL